MLAEPRDGPRPLAYHPAPAAHPGRLEVGQVTTADLLAAWRQATRAADEAARLARLAEQAADKADVDADAAAEIAELAQKAVEAAQRAAARAQAAADRATAFAASIRNPGVGDARREADLARAFETEARERFHDAEDQALRDSSREDEATKR